MKHILMLVSLVFVIIGVTNVSQNETISFTLVIVGGIYLAIQLLRGKVKAAG